MDSDAQWTIVVLFLLLVLLIILLFSKTPFLELFTTEQRWRKLDEHSDILEHWTGSTTSVPIRNHEAFDKGATLCYNNPYDAFIRMNYGIQDEKDAEQRLGQTETMRAQQLLDALPDVHGIPGQNLSSEQLQCTLQLPRCTSTDSLDSAASSITEVAKDVPMVKLTLKYD
ncbi:unnamed protein product [Angiostrongylus costaricensis]|uniref:DUF1559 domain-containing protein n=1 Tax=Angiostrongylus costaricensis TaxID=334426 RepID=A0A158PDZ5_ANGCS|nr:unnamed protein product [Angiostrongylus costaricensis]